MTKYTVNILGVIIILAILLVTFVTLKILGVIAWSWWIIFSPFWIETLCVVVLAFLFACYNK